MSQSTYIQELNPGYNHVVMLKSDGTVWTWGNDQFGELGNGTGGSTDYSSVPFEVSLPEPIQQVGGGDHFTWALGADGTTLYEWGNNAYGELGVGSGIPHSDTPVQVPIDLPPGVTIVTLANTFSSVLALLSNGQVMAWGSNDYGQCGLNPATAGDYIYTPTIIPGLSGVTQIAAGDYYCSALQSNGSVWAWGLNDEGELGTAGPANGGYSITPVQITGLPPIVQLASGGRNGMALDANGNIWEWGRNEYGELGNGTVDTSNGPNPIPTMVQGLPPIVSIDGSGPTALAADAQGNIYAWGYNLYGEVGNGSTIIDEPTPSLVLTLPTSPDSSGPSVQVAAGHWSSYAFNAVTGEVYAWGQNDFGQIGIPGTADTVPLPVNITSEILGTTATPPVITGTAQVGQTLTATAGTGANGGVLTYQWFSSANGYANPIGSGATYTVQESDEGARLEAVATVVVGSGASFALASPLTAPVLDSAPTVTTPTITGTVQEGQTLTASASAGQPDNTVTYQWFSSADGDTNPIGDGATYTVQESDEGYQLEVIATATNLNDVSVSQASAPTAPVLDAPPTVTTPVITGAAEASQILFASASAGQSDTTITYEWFTSANGYTQAIASGVSYTLQSGDVGYQFEVVAIAINGNGALVAAISAPTATVTQYAPPTVTTPAITGTAEDGQTLTAFATAGGSATTLAYQWFSSADGYTHPIVSGASYTVQPGDEGNSLEVVATAVNDTGIAVSQTSAPTAAVTENPSATILVSYVTATPSTGDFDAGQTVLITLHMTDATTVTGTPILNLTDGGKASYVSGSGTSALTFAYTVAAGQNTSALAVGSINLSNAKITNAANAHDFGSLAGAVGTIPGNLQIDTTAPTVNHVTTSPYGTTVGIGASVTLTMKMSEPVFVSGGIPTLALNDGGTATYVSGSGTSALNFQYTVNAGQNTTDLTVIGTALDGATITDAAGNVANLTGAITNPSGLLAIDTTPPTITAIAINPADGDPLVGAALNIQVKFSTDVLVTGGTPVLNLNDGGTASYRSGSGSNVLVFRYNPLAGQNTPDLAMATTNALVLNGASITDDYGNPAVLSGANGINPPGTMLIDTASTRVEIGTGTGQHQVETGNDNVVLDIGSATLTFEGGNDIAFLGKSAGGIVNATIYDQSSGLQVFVLDPGTDVFSGFASDPTAVVNLLDGIGGYGTVQQVMAALTSDGHGGTLLALGGGASIDFTGQPLSHLLASNFKVG